MGRLLVIPETLKEGPRNLRQGSQREMTLRDSSTDTEPGSRIGVSASVFLQDYGLKYIAIRPLNASLTQQISILPTLETVFR